MSPPVFESARLRMRPLSVDDAEAMHVVYSDEETMRYWSHPALGYWLVAPLPQWRQKKVRALVDALTS